MHEFEEILKTAWYNEYAQHWQIQGRYIDGEENAVNITLSESEQKFIVEKFENIEKRFSEFEIAMEKKDYDEINFIVKGIDEMVEHMKYVIKEVPAILIMCNELIPNKISSLSSSVNLPTFQPNPLLSSL